MVFLQLLHLFVCLFLLTIVLLSILHPNQLFQLFYVPPIGLLDWHLLVSAFACPLYLVVFGFLSLMSNNKLVWEFHVLALSYFLLSLFVFLEIAWTNTQEFWEMLFPTGWMMITIILIFCTPSASYSWGLIKDSETKAPRDKHHALLSLGLLLSGLAGIWSVVGPIFFMELFKGFTSRPSPAHVHLQTLNGIGFLIIAFGCYRSMNTKFEAVRWANMVGACAAWILWIIAQYLTWKVDVSLLRPSHHILTFLFGVVCFGCLFFQPTGKFETTFRATDTMKLFFH